jgi:hypothetical protein
VALPERRIQRLRWGFAAFAFIAMLAGMAAQGAYGDLTGAAPWRWSSLWVPLLVSPMVFGAFLSVIKSDIDVLTGTIMAFQNGFFWKQIFDGLAPILKTHGAP